MNNTKNPKAINAAKKYIQSKEQYLKTRSTWFYNILIAGAGLLGALVALSNNSREFYPVRVLFVLTVISLTLGILSVAIALYYDIFQSKRRQLEDYKRLQNIVSGANTDPTSLKGKSKTFLFFDILTYVFFSLSFISLIVYVIAKILPEWF